MYWPDVIDLKVFYSAPLGRVAQKAVASAIRRLWPHAHGETVLGIGYTLPYMEMVGDGAQHVLCLMPAAQGAVHWPHHQPNRTFLAEEGEIPLPSESINRIVMVHAIENTEQLRPMLREAWRVLTPEGRLLVIAPNRRGVWSRAHGSPFAHGSPYSSSQLRRVLKDHALTPLRTEYALFAPVISAPFCLQMAGFFESIGRRFFRPFGGVILMEAEKQLYAAIRQRQTAPVREKAYEQPAPKPVMTFTPR